MKMDTVDAEEHVPELEPLKSPSPEDINQFLESLKYDALDDSTPDNRHQRRAEMSREKLYRRFHAAGKHGELFVLRDAQGNVEGLLGLRADTPNQTGHITLLRTDNRERAQTGMSEKLLKAAERYLRRGPRSCTRAIIHGENPSEHVRMAVRHGSLSRFYAFQEDDSDADGADTYKPSHDVIPPGPHAERHQLEKPF